MNTGKSYFTLIFHSSRKEKASEIFKLYSVKLYFQVIFHITGKLNLSPMTTEFSAVKPKEQFMYSIEEKEDHSRS